MDIVQRGMPRGPVELAQMTGAELQRDPSPEAAAEIKRRNARGAFYPSYAAFAAAALGDGE